MKSLRVVQYTQITVLLFGLVVAPNLLACKCPSDRVLDARSALPSYAGVFLGKVASVQHLELPRPTSWGPGHGARVNLVTFQVEASWKGVQNELAVVLTADESCGYRFEVGSTYLVFARRYAGVASGIWGVDTCSLTKHASDAQADLKRLRKPAYTPG